MSGAAGDLPIKGMVTSESSPLLLGNEGRHPNIVAGSVVKGDSYSNLSVVSLPWNKIWSSILKISDDVAKEHKFNIIDTVSVSCLCADEHVVCPLHLL